MELVRPPKRDTQGFDVALLGPVDAVVRYLSHALGWDSLGRGAGSRDDDRQRDGDDDEEEEEEEEGSSSSVVGPAARALR